MNDILKKIIFWGFMFLLVALFMGIGKELGQKAFGASYEPLAAPLSTRTAMLVAWRQEGSLYVCTYNYLGTKFDVIMSSFCPPTYEI